MTTDDARHAESVVRLPVDYMPEWERRLVEGELDEPDCQHVWRTGILADGTKGTWCVQCEAEQYDGQACEEASHD